MVVILHLCAIAVKGFEFLICGDFDNNNIKRVLGGMRPEFRCPTWLYNFTNRGFEFHLNHPSLNYLYKPNKGLGLKSKILFLEACGIEIWNHFLQAL